jgi:hypothetical protein
MHSGISSPISKQESKRECKEDEETFMQKEDMS